MIHVYGVVRAPGALPAAPAVDEAPLRAVAADHLTAIVSDHDRDPRPTGPRLLRHELVLQALLPEGVVPVRYGAALPDDATLGGLLARRAGQFDRLLELVRGRREMGVRVALSGDGAKAVTGRDYLLTKLHREHQARQAAEGLDRLLGPLAAGRRTLAAGDDLRVAYLVEACRVAEFRAHVEALAGGPLPGAVCTGPWPAYSFVTEEQP